MGEIGDVRAVEPLVAALQSSNDYVRRTAVELLIKIGMPAMEPLIAALKNPEWYARLAAAEALGKIGNAHAVELLIAALKESSKYVRLAAAEALDRLGWQPGQDEDGARYWVMKQEWDRCTTVGAPAVQPLIAALSDGSKPVRQGAAQALVSLYKKGQLAESSRQRILACRKLIQAHNDSIIRTDYGGHRDNWPELLKRQNETPMHVGCLAESHLDIGTKGTVHTDIAHIDEGIGIEFPL